MDTKLFLLQFNNDETTFLARAANEEYAVLAFITDRREAGCLDAMREEAKEQGEDVRDLVNVVEIPDVAPGKVVQVDGVLFDA